MNQFISKVILFVSVLFVSSAFASEWELKKDVDGVKVYTKSIEGSKIKAFKGTVTLDVKLDTVIAVLKDIDAFPQWIPDLKEARQLELKDMEQIHYLHTDAPWPVSDRDGIYQYTYIRNKMAEAPHVLVKIISLPDYLPKKDNIVRITDVDGYWKLTPTTNGVEVVYRIHANPGGGLPKWLVNSKIVDTPFKSLTNLKERVKEPKYLEAEYPYLNPIK